MSIEKTNALRHLDQKKISYDLFTYSVEDGKIDGVSVAHKIGKDPEHVYKTLITIGNSKSIYVFIIPVQNEIDLKKAAKVAGEKSLSMLQVKDLLTMTGYVRGGCSPVGMKKAYKTFFQSSAVNYDKIVVSAGKIGLQMYISVADLISVTKGSFEDVVI